jgi:peptidoglycan/xylan/chitin deacetylase (PgdA/CDA1 family)
MEIGSHSLDHVRLPYITDDELAEQVEISRLQLADISGQEVTGFCYPYGEVGEREVEAVRAAGYDYACSVNSLPLNGRHAVPRTFIGDQDTSPRLFAKVARHRLTVGRAVR